MAKTGSHRITQYAFYFGCFGTAFDDDEVLVGAFGFWGW